MRIVLAIIAGLLSVLLAHTHSFASTPALPGTETPACTMEDYYLFVEARDAIGLDDDLLAQVRMAETFLAACPKHPKRGAISLNAAQTALNVGLTNNALRHFQTADLAGETFDRNARLDHMSALFLNNQTARAMKIRNTEIDLWLAEIATSGLGTIETARLHDGMVHKVSFDAVEADMHEQLVWLMVPFGDGLPASLSLTAERNLIELLSLRIGPKAEGLQMLRLNGCFDRSTLHRSIDGISEPDAERAAHLTAKAYLAKPDAFSVRPEGQPAMTCFNSDRVFISPDPATAVPIY